MHGSKWSFSIDIYFNFSDKHPFHWPSVIRRPQMVCGCPCFLLSVCLAICPTINYYYNNALGGILRNDFEESCNPTESLNIGLVVVNATTANLQPFVWVTGHLEIVNAIYLTTKLPSTLCAHMRLGYQTFPNCTYDTIGISAQLSESGRSLLYSFDYFRSVLVTYASVYEFGGHDRCDFLFIHKQ